jgi:peptide/nickel transport system substrate-binding protein
VPAGSPAQDTSTHPLPATGPYMLRSYKPGKQVVETRNPHFDAAALGGNVPSGNPDEIVWDIVGTGNLALQRTIAGQDDWDPQPIPARRLASVRDKRGDQLKIFTTPNTYYFFMNGRVAPFDKVQVRRAVNYAIDRRALAGIYDGLAVPTENILPPGYPQFRAHALYPHNLARAKRLIRAAGATGAKVTVWTHNSDLDAKTTEYLVSVLNSIGLQATQKVIGTANYWSTVGNEATKAQIGFANWFQDYPHPLDWFGVLLSGEQLAKQFNQNYASYDSKAVDAQIGALRGRPRLTPALNRRWAALDKRVMEDAPWAPFVNRQFTDFFNPRVDLGCYENHILYGFDYATICVKAG